jgi:serine/threonine protein kinase
MIVAQSSPYPSAGEIIDGKYKIEKILGEGGMGAVARATHVVLGGAVALKFMNPQFMTYPGAVERFVNEGRASKAIRSEHVLPVLDVGLLPNGAPYLLMECLQGCDLSQLIEREGPSGLPVDRAIHFVVQILRGLQSAHAINIIHRDMKPSNCFVVTNDGEVDFVKILDFGISKVIQPGSSSLTQTNTALGTPLYMSPEQARSSREVDARTDIYAAGVILYELLSGRTPFSSDTGEFTEILFKLFTTDPPPLRKWCPDLDPALAAVVHKALARDVAARFSTVLEMAEALAPFARGRAADRIERMRAFVPPSLSSGRPAELPTSMAALSQLQRARESEALRAAPETLAAPVGALDGTALLGSPVVALQARTALLDRPEISGADAARERGNMADRVELPRADSPASAVESSARTQLLEDAPRRPLATQAGLAVDAPEGKSRRSPLVIVLPVAAVLILAGLGGVVSLSKRPEASSARAGESSTTAQAPRLDAPSARLSAATAVPSSSAASSPASSASGANLPIAPTPTASAPASAQVPRPTRAASPPPAERPAGRYDPGLDTKIKTE